METLYTMKLGDVIKFTFWDVVRVPGGWLFSLNDSQGGHIAQFIPFDNEFMK